MPPTAARSAAWPRILAESLEAPDDPLPFLLRRGPVTSPHQAVERAARALLDLEAIPPGTPPPWLAPHQRPAFVRLNAILARYGGAVLADAVGLGKSYVALAVAQASRLPLTLVVPACLVPQWRALATRLGVQAAVITHERLSRPRPPAGRAPGRLVVVDEAHHFRNARTARYGALARLAVGAKVLLVTATPVFNRTADLINLLRLFLRDDQLTGLGLPSLRLAAADAPLLAASVAARLVVARSRRRVNADRGAPHELRFPERAPGETVTAPPAEEAIVDRLVDGIRRLDGKGGVAGLFRLLLLRRLASSVPALRRTIARSTAFGELAHAEAVNGRSLARRDFARIFPRGEADDLQLALLPLLLPRKGAVAQLLPGGAALRSIATMAACASDDPKARALGRVLDQSPGSVLVFAESADTVHYLRRRLAPTRRVAAVTGNTAWLGLSRAMRAEALRAFSPRAQSAGCIPRALRAHILLATDLAGEGLNLQDADTVVHYDLPWSPARLAQRVGRIDRLGSPHRAVRVVTFLPPESLAATIATERRLAAKVALQVSAGAAQVETLAGPRDEDALFDWCDRLQRVTREEAPDAPDGVRAGVVLGGSAVVLIVRLADVVEGIVVDGTGARADPAAAATLLERARDAASVEPDCARIEAATRRAAPLVRERLDALRRARWRQVDRDRPGRRLVPMVLAAARAAAQAGRAGELARLDAVLARLVRGMTMGEELLLEDLLRRPGPLSRREVLAWHEALAPLTREPDPPTVTLVAALEVR